MRTASPATDAPPSHTPPWPHTPPLPCMPSFAMHTPLPWIPLHHACRPSPHPPLPCMPPHHACPLCHTCPLHHAHSPSPMHAPHVNRMTDACEYITLPQTSFVGGKNSILNHIPINGQPNTESLISKQNWLINNCLQAVPSFSLDSIPS